MRASISSLSRVSLSYALSLSLSSSCMQRDFGGGVALHSGERARRGHDGYHDLGRAGITPRGTSRQAERRDPIEEGHERTL